MKYRKAFAFHLIMCLGAVLHEVEAQVKKTRVDDYSYEYSYEYNGGGSKEKPAEPVDHRFPCYTCVYHQIDGNSQGTVNCNEPFNSDQVPEVMCNGFCGMTYIWTKKPTDFLITRDCRKTCKEVVSEIQYVRCCSTKLCNSFISSVRQDKFSLCLTILLSVFTLVYFELFS